MRRTKSNCVTFRFSRKSRRTLQNLWNDIYKFHELRLVPEDLENKYKDIFRAYVSEIISMYVLHRGVSPACGFAGCITYDTYVSELVISNHIDISDLYDAIDRGSELACDIVEEISDTDDPDQVDEAIGNSIYQVLPTPHSFNVFETALADDLDLMRFPDFVYDDDAVFSVRPTFSRFIVTDHDFEIFPT